VVDITDCTAERPVVDRLEIEVGQKLYVRRINLQDQIGHELTQVNDFKYPPTFIFFDVRGTELGLTIGEIDPQRMRDSVNQ
jgi:hypothetical protein